MQIFRLSASASAAKIFERTKALKNASKQSFTERLESAQGWHQKIWSDRSIIILPFFQGPKSKC